MPLVRSAAELVLDDLPRLPWPDRVLLADPDEYDIAYGINPHMRDEHGALLRVDRARARAQHAALAAELAACGLALDRVPALAGSPDLVFCANQALPIPAAASADGVPRVVPSRMAHPERRGEVPHVVAALEALGYRVEPLAGAARLEGMGDGLWHPGRRLLWAGVGPRSAEAAWAELAERHDLPVVPLELVDPSFYHLDTALALLAEDACLWHPPALAPAARELVRALVPRRVEADPDEARRLLACNAFSPDGRRVLLERAAERTSARLAEAGFEPVGLDTGEFLKAGGSVFCMKLAHGPLP